MNGLHSSRLRLRLSLCLTLLLALGTAGFAPALHAQPSELVGLYLTWQRDPTTTMTIDWHTAGRIPSPTLEYRAAGASSWRSEPASSRPFPFSERVIHRVELTGLEPAAEYEFRTGPQARTYRFRTMPATADQPIRFAAGGDVRHNKEWMEKTNRQVLPYEPEFVMFGGDLAYADGMERNVDRWYEWFDALMNTLVTEAGRVIPVIVGIGNHEVRGGYFHADNHANRAGLPPYAGDDASRAAIAPYFYELFAMPGQPGYQVLDFGDYLSVILLDSDHSNPVDGPQTAWLESVLSERRHVPHVFPIYHVPAYPSVRSFDGPVSVRVREHWVPLFERYGVRVVFENHDHIYKRTFPLRAGKISGNGIIYLGDGAWGVSTRQPGRDHRGRGGPWYLDRAESVRHFILGTIHGPHQHFLMVDEEGNVFDEYPRVPELAPQQSSGR